MPPVHVTPTPRAHSPGSPLRSLWRLRNYLRPYVWQLAVMLVAACVASGSAIVIPLLTKSVIDSAIAHGNRRLLILLSLAALGLGATQAILNFIRRWIQAGAVTGMEQAIRDDLYAHLQRLDTAFHSEWQSGQLLSRATTDLSTIRRFAGFGIVFAITNMVQFAVVVALLVSLNWVLGLLTGAVFLPVMAVSTWFERRYTVLSRSAQDQQGDLATYVEEAATGLGVIKALGRRVEFAHTHGASATRVYRTQVAKARLRGNFWASLELIPNIIIGMIVLFGALAVSHHTLTLGGLVAFITLTLQLVWPIEAVGYILASGQEAATAAQRVYEILDSQPAISDRPAVSAAVTGALSAATLPRPRPAVETAVLRRQHPARLVFDGVRFSYPQASQPVLRSVSLTVEPGKTLALVGATGSGKTTLLQLVPRLADPEAGSITLDGVDVGDMPLVRLRARVGCTFEEPSLFSVSVRENVTLGVSGASAAEIEQALATAHADFVYELPWGLDTRIGEQGMSLSGGQRQRLALARAILAGPQVLVLDDPLSALDVRTEEKVTLALRQVLAGTTALIVAHRPSTVLLADSVALLADGVIAAQGTHADLLATDARYRALMSGTHPAPASQRAAAPPGLTSTPRAEGRGAAWTEERPREPQGRGAVWTEERPREPQGRGAVWTEEREASAASAGATREDGASGRPGGERAGRASAASEGATREDGASRRPGGERAGRASAGATREDGALRHPEASGVSRVLPGGPEASGTSSDEGAQAVAR